MSQQQSQSTGIQGQTQSGVIINSSIRAAHPDLIEMILSSESMNDEERQYWVDMLPIMNDEQRGQLRSILENERDQLRAIDAKYSKQIDEIAQQKQPLEEMQTARRTRAQERESQEQASRQTEEQAAEHILEQVDRE